MLPISYMFAVQTDDNFDKGDIMQCTVAYVLKYCQRASMTRKGTENMRAAVRSMREGTRWWLKCCTFTAETQIFEQHATCDELIERGLCPDYPLPSGMLIAVN
jgi:hypothetical protein